MKRTTLSAVALTSLLIISFSVSASNVMLDTSIGTHEFESFSGTNLISDGSFIIRNQDNKVVKLNLSIENNIFENDLDLEGNPRQHSVSNIVFFHSAPTKDWIQLEKTTLTIPPNSEGVVNYTINIPISELPSYTNTTNGFLSYITIKGGTINANGNSVGVNYQYKIFMIFNGELPAPNPLPLIFIALGLSLLVYFILGKTKQYVVKRKCQKKY